MSVVGIIVSFAFVFIMLGVVTLLLKKDIVNAFTARKLVYISVAHWWIIALYFFDSPIWASIPPIVFIVLNIISYRKHLFKAMEADEHKKNLGTVYFPISLLVLVVLSYLNIIPKLSATVGVFVLGYADAFAALFGERFGKEKLNVFGDKKSIVGTLTMFAVASVAVAVVLALYPGVTISVRYALFASIATGLFAAGVELFTPFGFDNISVPLLTSIFFTAVFWWWV